MEALDLAAEAVARMAWQAKLDLAEEAGQLEQMTLRFEAASEALAAALAAVNDAVARVDSRLSQLLAGADDVAGAFGAAADAAAQHLGGMAGLLDDTSARGATVRAEAEAAAARMTQTLADLEDASQRTTQLIANRAYALDGAVTGVLDRSVQILDSIRESLLAHGQALETSVKAARDELDGWGRDGAADLEARLTALTDRTRHVQAAIEAQQAVAATVTSDMDRGLADLEQRLGQLRDGASGEVDRLAATLSAVDTAAAAAEGKVGALAAAVERMRPAIDSYDADVASRLPAVEQTASTLEAIVQESEARVAALHRTLEACADMLSALSEARATEEAKFEALIQRFMAARVQ
jgi:chromosome segregation ATPase